MKWLACIQTIDGITHLGEIDADDGLSAIEKARQLSVPIGIGGALCVVRKGIDLPDPTVRKEAIELGDKRPFARAEQSRHAEFKAGI